MWQVLFRRAFSAFSMAAFAVALGCRWVLVPGWAGRVWVEVAGHPTTSSSCDLKAELCCSCLRSRLQPITFVTYGTSQSQCLSFHLGARTRGTVPSILPGSGQVPNLPTSFPLGRTSVCLMLWSCWSIAWSSDFTESSAEVPSTRMEMRCKLDMGGSWNWGTPQF